MMWKTDCKQIKHWLALWAGNDLEEHVVPQVRVHLAECDHCRHHWTQLQAGRQVLAQLSRQELPRVSCPPLWPALRVQITSQLRAYDRRTWRGWLPMGALAAACLAFVMITQPATSYGPPLQRRAPLVLGQPVVADPLPGWYRESLLGLDRGPSPHRSHRTGEAPASRTRRSDIADDASF